MTTTYAETFDDGLRTSKRHAPPNNGTDMPLLRKLDYVLADELPDDDESFDDELVEGVIGRHAMAVLYGDTNSGKTFAAIEMGAAIGRGISWLGRRCDTGLVVYLATEAVES